MQRRHGAGNRAGWPAAIAALLATAAALTFLLAQPSATPPAPEFSADAGYGALPLAFEPNAGRYPDPVHFTSKSSAGTIAATERGILISNPAATRQTDTIALRFPGADLRTATPRERLEGLVHDLRGGDPSKWVSEIPTFGAVRYRQIHPGVDLDLYGRGGALEYDLRLAPGTDPGELAVKVAGAEQLRINGSGDLVAKADRTRFVQKAPVAYQPSPEGRIPVEASFRLEGQRLAFALGPYDSSRRLVIDPLTLAYSTYLGGNSSDIANAIAVDSSGAAYIAGFTLLAQGRKRGSGLTV